MMDDFSLARPVGHLIMGDGSGLDGLAKKDGAKALSRAESVDTATTQLDKPSRTKNSIIESYALHSSSLTLELLSFSPPLRASTLTSQASRPRTTVDIREVHNTLVWRKGKRIRVELDKQRVCRKFCSGGCEGAGRMVEKQRQASRRLSVIVTNGTSIFQTNNTCWPYCN